MGDLQKTAAPDSSWSMPPMWQIYIIVAYAILAGEVPACMPYGVAPCSLIFLARWARS
jgi:hypothetical protein